MTVINVRTNRSANESSRVVQSKYIVNTIINTTC